VLSPDGSLVFYNSKYIHTYIHTYQSRLVPEGVAEASQIFLRDHTFYQNDMAMRNIKDVIGGKPSSSDCSLSQVGML
jgi:hypothetical protein